ncbi:MAG: glutathionylspermidine synthase family protein [Chthoniobacteraceae bacterium]|nr:glutathionylspermidine synthase family protein [Chthoniobacteraceae bacterium]
MQRLSIEPRADWQEKVESLGMVFHTAETPYWDESAFYAFTMREVLELEAATNELFRLCCAAVEHVLSKELWDAFHIPRAFAPMIRRSWEEDDVALYGRFDLCYNGTGAPKLYEFNADTPTSLLEAAVVQWHWLQECFPGSDQFNSIHERLIAHWKASGIEGRVHFAMARGSDEEFATTVYLEDTAQQAGLATDRLFVDEIGWDGRAFVDRDETPIRTLFKLYPWEWLVREEFANHLLAEPWRVIEPPWKMILSNKRLLPLLWELFPGHRNLLPAFTTPGPLGGSYARKPLFGREGAGISLVKGANEVTTGGEPEVDGGFIYQALQLPPLFEGHFPVIGSWIIGGEAAGMGIREGATPVTNQTSRFVPHRIAG